MNTLLSDFARDTLDGLSASPKYLLSKYFYDANGSKIFQDIMAMPEYYLTDCEQEIFSLQKEDIIRKMIELISDFNLIELGSGDGVKTKILLAELLKQSVNFTFTPIDISADANAGLVDVLGSEFPQLKISPKTGDYFKILDQLNQDSHAAKIIFFLGANIGNYSTAESQKFLTHLEAFTRRGDALLIGFDLKKEPDVIIQAYDDPHGHTKKFNLNHLARMNRELGANFALDQFQHHSSYDPISGDMKSFLLSLKEQQVEIKALNKTFIFRAWEAIFMERSKKYDFQMINDLAKQHGFNIAHNYLDDRKYFVDSLWIKA